MRHYYGPIYIIRRFFTWAWWFLLASGGIFGVLLIVFLSLLVPGVGIFIAICVVIGLLIGGYRSRQMLKAAKEEKKEEELQDMIRKQKTRR